MRPKKQTPEEILQSIQFGVEMDAMDRLALTLKAENDPFFRNKVDKMHGIFSCWNCGHAMQKPTFIKNIKGKGKGTNTMKLRCQCGESTDIKF